MMRSLIFAAAALTLGTAAAPTFAGGARQGGYNPDYLPAVETQQSSAAMVALGGGAHGPVETVNSLPAGFADHMRQILVARTWPPVDTQSSSVALAPLGGGGGNAPVETVNALPVGFADHTPRMLAAHIRDNWYASRAQRQNMAREGNVVPKG
jgi:hypothetical protein